MINKIRIALVVSLVAGAFTIIFLRRIARSTNTGDELTWSMVLSNENILITILVMLIAAPIGYMWKSSDNDKDDKDV